jgi:tRNA A-37 threonylcarbamoyl transferase component Bud32
MPPVPGDSQGPIGVERAPPAFPAGERELKRGPSRSVRVARAEGGAEVVIKRFARAGPTRLLDRARARREFEVLRALHGSGVSVPRPLELREGLDACEVVMECASGAPLQAILEGRAPWPVPPRRVARDLGRLLAELHARGLDHPDLHAGNVLVQPAGGLVALDFHKARLGARLTGETLERHLVQLAAGAREFAPRSFRARFAAAWRAALPAALVRELPPARELARRVEARARILRREVVRRRQARWTRAGTAVEPLAPGGVWARAGCDPARIRALRAGRPGPGDHVLHPRSKRAARALWRTAARLYEHRVPCAAPLLLDCAAARPWLALDLPPGARPARPAELAAARTLLAAELGERALAAALEPAHVWIDAGGRPLLVAVAELADA